MVKRIAAIIFIFICATAAWVALGGTILVRTYEADERLKDRVVSTWGAPHVQQAPRASFDRIVASRVEQIVDGRKVATTKEETVTEHLALVRTRARADLAVEHRQKGLLWYSTYAVKFAGEYSFVNQSDASRTVTFTLPFPAQQATYDDVALTVNGRAMEPSYSASSASASASAEVPAGQTALFQLSYRSRGLDRWGYNFGENVSGARDFQLVVATNFKDYDFPDNTLSPTDKQENDGGAQLTWQYNNLVSGVPIAIAMPQKLQPGPLAGQISFFAPVSLFFFFFLMFIITTMRGIELHPMNYFFLAGAFFAFHLLLAYLVDHISIHLAFAICSLVSVFLVVSYLRLVVGVRFAAVEAAISQLIYLVFFSYAFFFKGFTGLAITIGAIITLFVVMQMTGRIRWEQHFAPKPARA
ncbi:MAG: inner membrane CreD family protein [Candidatus Acidiferrales bacterium]